MATFKSLTAENRAAAAKAFGWDVPPVDQKEWDERIQKTPVAVNEATTKYVRDLCAAGWEAQSGGERAYVAQHSGACPWSATSDADRKRLFATTVESERTGTRQRICEHLWSGAVPTLEESGFLEKTGGKNCGWSDLSDSWKRRQAVESSGKSRDDAHWKRVFEGVCNRTPWNRTDDERQIVANLCNTKGVCASCEVRFATGSTERQMILVAIVVAFILFLIALFR